MMGFIQTKYQHIKSEIIADNHNYWRHNFRIVFLKPENIPSKASKNCPISPNFGSVVNRVRVGLIAR